MNICILTSTFHPLIGGTETYALVLGEALTRLGHKVIVLTDLIDSADETPQFVKGIEVHRASFYRSLLNDPEKILWEQMYFGLLVDFEKILSNRRIDLIHANSQDCALVGSMLSQSLNVPFVCTMHEQSPEDEPFGIGRCRLVYNYLPIDVIIAGSEFYQNRALHFGTPKERIRLIYHGINTTFFSPNLSGENIRQRFQFQQNDFVVVCAARLKERKGLVELIHAIVKVKEVIPNIKLLIAGSCNSASRAYANTLYRMRDDFHLQNTVTIEENLLHSDMPHVFAAADLVVQPSLAEGLSFSILEAMSCGKPVIGTSILGIGEIVTHEQNGLLVPPRQVEPLAEAIIRMASDSEMAKRLVMAGLQTVRTHFSIQHMVTETERTYQELLGK